VVGVGVEVAQRLALAHQHAVLHAPDARSWHGRIDQEVAPAGQVLPVEERDRLGLRGGGDGQEGGRQSDRGEDVAVTAASTTATARAFFRLPEA
jgi:hypothetical protein